MKRLFAGAALALCLFALPSIGNANIISNLGNNPNSATGHFSNSVLGTTFDDQYTFNLTGGPQFVTFASATNDFLSSTDFITNFRGQLFSAGADGVPGGVGANADTAIGPIDFASPCATNPTGCQILAGSAILGTGSYFLDIAGIGGGTSGYGGDLTVRALAVPGPMVGAGLPGLIAGALTLFGVMRRRRRAAA
jgi:hypothetical protein